MADSELDKIISKPKQGADAPLGSIKPGDAEDHPPRGRARRADRRTEPRFV